MLAGDLGAIDAKYDIAVSTSCGALDYIVVDNTATAQCCVELLRRQGLGVATFLILDKQQHLAAALQTKPTPPEGESVHSMLADSAHADDALPFAIDMLFTWAAPNVDRQRSALPEAISWLCCAVLCCAAGVIQGKVSLMQICVSSCYDHAAASFHNDAGLTV